MLLNICEKKYKIIYNLEIYLFKFKRKQKKMGNKNAKSKKKDAKVLTEVDISNCVDCLRLLMKFFR